MNKRSKLLLAGVVALGILGAGGYYAFLLQSESQSVGQAKSTSTEPQNSSSEQSSSTDASKGASTDEGTYTAFSSINDVTSEEGTKVLFFHAPWCPQCRQLDGDLAKADIPSGVMVYKTDYDSNQDLRAKYGVTLQTTFVAIDSQGQLVKKYVAYEEPTFDAVNRDFISKL